MTMEPCYIESEFLQMIQDNERLIYKICSFYASDKQPLADLYQETLGNLWRSYPNFRGESSFSTWIYRVALNTCITGFRKEMRRPEKITLSPLHETLPEPESLTDSIAEMYTLIHRLGELERAIVLLYLEEKSYKEIAEITGLTVCNVATKLKRTKMKLRDMSNL